jgi:hypothetical protein
MSLRGMLCSEGNTSARVFLVFAVPPRGPSPSDERERVVLTDPARLPAPGLAPTRAEGPRRPDQRRLTEKPQRVELPDGRGALQTQRVIVDRDWILELMRTREEP